MDHGADATPPITELLRRSREDPEAREQVYRIVYDDLRSIARARLGRSDSSQTLSPTALVHEAYLKLVNRTAGAWNDRRHFLRLAARAMRDIAVDTARARHSAKRGGGQRAEPLNEEGTPGHAKPEMVLALEETLDELRETNPRLIEIVECRFFAGYTTEETAEALECSLRTVQREWGLAREWIKQRLSKES